VTNGKKTQAACEDNILRLLITAEGPLLDNLELIATLDTSKETWEKVNKFNTTMAQTSPHKQTNKQTKHLDLDQNVKTNFKILLLLLLITTIVDLGGAWSTKFSQWKKNLQYMRKTLNPKP
jgi:hypothetical protein